MIPVNLTVAICFLLLSFFLYTYLVFKLTDTFLENARIKRNLYRIPTAIVNMMLFLPLTVFPHSTSIYAYVLGGITLFVEFSLFYRDKISASIFCASACILHVMAIRSICVSIFSIFTGYTMYYIANDITLLIHSTCISFLTVDVVIVLVLKLIPAKNIKIINQHNIQLWFMIAWMTIFNIYMLSDAVIYSIPEDHPSLIATHILAPIAILLGLYIVLFFSIKTGMLLGYKEKSEELQYTIDREQQYRELMIKDSLMTYEFNVSKNLVLNCAGTFIESLGEKAANYSDMLVFVVQNFMHPDDSKDIIKNFLPGAILAGFDNGKSENIIEYRRLKPSGEYSWVRLVTNFVKDNQTGDVKGFTYIKDIDKEKRRQIELQNKAERDSLTGLYNKGTTTMMIKEDLCSDRTVGGALFIVDVDNFKMINDHLGHMYGDAVLCELSEKLKESFVSDGIVGRIGGDEFMAFVKNPISVEEILLRAKNICSVFYNSYRGETEKSYIVSGSIGIALFPRDGKSFEELYKNADAALYAVKSAGKNSFRIYDRTATVEYESNRTEIDTIETNSPKNFKENKIEYVFKILYASDDHISAIYAVLELVTNHFKFDRGYIFETSKDEKTTSNTYEWCREGVKSEIDNLQNVPIEAVATANASFYKTSMFILNNLNGLEPMERAVLEPQGIQSMFQFGLLDHGKLLGFIGFDNCITPRQPNDDDVNELLTICNILATFFVKQRLTEYAAKNLTALIAVMDSLDNFTYVVEKDTFRILFMNEKTEKIVGSIVNNPRCYYHFRGNNEQCSDCPICGLTNEKQSRCICEVFNVKFNLWTETTASHINWIDGQNAFLINCLDITKYKT